MHYPNWYISEELEPTDAPITVLTTIQATSDQTFDPRCAHNPMETQCNQSQYPNPNHNFALPQFMVPLKPTDTPSTVPITHQASSDHTLNPNCAHDPMAT